MAGISGECLEIELEMDCPGMRVLTEPDNNRALVEATGVSVAISLVYELIRKAVCELEEDGATFAPEVLRKKVCEVLLGRARARGALEGAHHPALYTIARTSELGELIDLVVQRAYVDSLKSVHADFHRWVQ